MARQPRIRIDVSGPLFQPDAMQTFAGNIRRMIEGASMEGEKATRSAIDSLVLPHSTGWTRDHVIGRAASMSGKPWWLHAVISANTDGMDRKTAIRTKAAASSVEGRFHPFRRVASALRRSRAVLSANLTEGLE